MEEAAQPAGYASGIMCGFFVNDAEDHLSLDRDVTCGRGTNNSVGPPGGEFVLTHLKNLGYFVDGSTRAEYRIRKNTIQLLVPNYSGLFHNFTKAAPLG